MPDTEMPELPPMTGEEPLPVEPPLDDSDDFDENPEGEGAEEVFADPEKKVRKRRGRPKRFQPEPISTAQSPGRLLPVDQLTKYEDFDLWVQQFDWDRPKMRIMIKRISPTHHQGISVGGQLGAKDNAPFTFDEIRQRWGGGEYRVAVFGPRNKDDQKQVPLAALRLQIPGQPLLDEDALPEDTRNKMQQNWGRGPRPVDPGTRAMEIVGSEVEALRRRVYEGPQGPDTAPYERMTDEIKAAAEQRIAAREAAADERSRAATELLAMERKERERLSERVHQMEKETREKESEMQVKLAETLKSSQGSSLELVSTLLPQMSASASEQVKMVVAQYSAREERLAVMHAQELAAADKTHQTQLNILAQQHQLQIASLNQMHENNVTLLKAQIEGLKTEKEILRQQLEESRRQVDRAREELMQRISTQKETNPLDQMSMFAQILEMAKSITGGGGGGDNDEIGAGLEDNPILSNIMKLGGKYAPVLQAFAEQRNQHGMPQMPPQGLPPGYGYPPGYGPPPQQPQQVYYPQVMPQQVMPQPAPQPGRVIAMPQPPQRPKLKREDLVAAIDFINGVLSQPEPLPVDDVARGAIATQDSAVLKELCRRTPEKLLAKLEEEGILVGPCSTDSGKAYVVELLKVLKQKLAQTDGAPRG